MKYLMCVPNISEGRDRALVEEVIGEIRGVSGVKLLNHSSDPDHNRSVLTYLGEPDAVLEATRNMTLRAFSLIDMTLHRGSHPRMGAVDVVPFIPVRGVEIPEAVEVSRRFGRFVGEQGVPVYYYEDAATRPGRVNLAEIRKGEYEGLESKLLDPEWLPDEGPAVFNPRSGALVTGCRFALIAFNVNLNTTDLEVAKEIAKAVRHISGGYRYVKAIGLSLKDEGLVQVSMNLTNYRKTPIHRVVETIRFEAARYGVTLAGSEVIGTLPLEALEEAARYYLQAHGFSSAQIIETALIE